MTSSRWLSWRLSEADGSHFNPQPGLALVRDIWLPIHCAHWVVWLVSPVQQIHHQTHDLPIFPPHPTSASQRLHEEWRNIILTIKWYEVGKIGLVVQIWMLGFVNRVYWNSHTICLHIVCGWFALHRQNQVDAMGTVCVQSQKYWLSSFLQKMFADLSFVTLPGQTGAQAMADQQKTSFFFSMLGSPQILSQLGPFWEWDRCCRAGWEIL